MMKAWKKKLHTGRNEGNNMYKRSLRTFNDVKRRHSVASNNEKVIAIRSCLKSPDIDTNSTLYDDKKSESDSTRVSKGSSTLDSTAGRTVSTCGCSSKSKKVRFDTLEIRPYERIASDNPCCSSGPPIGIGWIYGEEIRSNVNDYEQSREDRKFNLDIVLTRSEREALLLEWDVDTRTIAASVRAATKIKFQRKNTVLNLRKFSKLEEAIEITSRRLKKALLPKNRTDYIEDELVEQTPSQTFELDHSAAGETISISSVDEDNKSRLHVTELDEDLIEKLIQNTFDIPTLNVCNEGDNNASDNDEFTLGATTLGNTSSHSPSIIEIEKFYRELELEMFGEETELPSMVGQTLEVPQDVERSLSYLNNSGCHEFMTEDETFFNGSSYHDPQYAHLEKHPSRYFRDKPQIDSYVDCAFSDTHNSSYSCDAYKMPTTNKSHQNGFVQNLSNKSALIQGASLPVDAEFEHAHSMVTNPYRKYNDWFNHPFQRQPTAERKPIPVSAIGLDYPQNPCDFYRPKRSQDDNYHQYRHRKNRSFDSSYDIALMQNQIQHSSSDNRIQQDVRSQLGPQYLKSSSLQDTIDLSFRSDPGENHTKLSFCRSSRDSNFDEPRVHHMPLHGKLSANQWIDGIDREGSYCNNHTTVTITEDDC